MVQPLPATQLTMTEECDHTLDPADSNLFECCEEMTRVKAPDLCSMGIIINMAEALLRRNSRLHQSPDSPAITSVFREIKEALQARELALPVPSMLSLEEQASKSTSPMLPQPSQSSPSAFLDGIWSEDEEPASTVSSATSVNTAPTSPEELAYTPPALITAIRIQS